MAVPGQRDVTVKLHCCCAGIMELEPSTLWNPQVVAGIGAVPDPTKLHTDMHTYLAGAPALSIVCVCGCMHCEAGANVVPLATSTLTAGSFSAPVGSLTQANMSYRCCTCILHQLDQLPPWMCTCCQYTADPLSLEH